MWYTASVLEQGSARQSALFFSFVALGVPVKLLSFSGVSFRQLFDFKILENFFFGEKGKRNSHISYLRP